MSEKRLVLATFNPNKFEEIRSEFHIPGVVLNSLSDYPGIVDAPEEGAGFEEIARAKADYYYDQIREPVLTEDSGLVIPSLDGYPGIYSARIAGTDRERIQLVLNRLKSLETREESAREAYYICCITLRTPEGLWTTEGRCSGVIRREPEGSGGFGYDPVFRPLGSRRTFGNMSRKEKAQFSHRIRALKKMIPVIQEVLGVRR